MEQLDDSFRYWLLTSTTYGTWLPGDRRGFVSHVRDEQWHRVIHNIPGTPYDLDNPVVQGTATAEMRFAPVYLGDAQARVVLAQFQETCRYRGWRLLAAAVMRNHFHVILRVSGNPSPEVLLRDLKSYASRALSDFTSVHRPGAWWTVSGSKRRLKAESSVHAGVRYVLQQEYPLVTWAEPEFRDSFLKSGERGT